MILKLEQDDIEKLENLLSKIAIKTMDKDLCRIIKAIRYQIDHEENNAMEDKFERAIESLGNTVSEDSVGEDIDSFYLIEDMDLAIECLKTVKRLKSLIV